MSFYLQYLMTAILTGAFTVIVRIMCSAVAVCRLVISEATCTNVVSRLCLAESMLQICHLSSLLMRLTTIIIYGTDSQFLNTSISL